ncbi:chromate efflux transporter [Yanghanlia caeni]|uniref:Chromate efflux transporter n=1 Tax=Yanghanlia caeni TaxID=3064283 RepID=A0ABU1D909_9BURK|nr:chromate efflux transporter [Alcaligenaceae bacterium LG-2]
MRDPLTTRPASANVPPGTPWEVFIAFLKLGLTSFGGPIAHLGYFHSEFVNRRRWLDDRRYADLVALCQFLPGPTSSQVGMALGLGRAGWRGMLAAWAGFTLPSAFILILFALGVARYTSLVQSGWVHGLKVAAFAIVAHAVWGMSKTLCPDVSRKVLAAVALGLALAIPGSAGQIAALIVAGLVRWWLPNSVSPAQAGGQYAPLSPRVGLIAAMAFMVLLLGLPLWSAVDASGAMSLVEAVYRAGALVFGGGHVVLPLLQASIVPNGFVSNDQFLAGYGAAQAVPGPLFTFAAYIGTVASGPLTGWLGGLVLLIVIFIPAALVLLAALPFWQKLNHRAGIRRALAGVNAGVVGILLAALYDPLWLTAMGDWRDVALAVAAFALLLHGRTPPVLVVLLAGIGGWILAV